MASDPLCGCALLRCRLHAPDHRAARDESDSRFPAFEYGGSDFRDRGLGDSPPAPVRAGVVRVCADAFGNCAGTATGETGALRASLVIYA